MRSAVLRSADNPHPHTIRKKPIMLLLRILTLPIAMLTFSALYSISIKAPQLVEIGSLVLWTILPLFLIAKLTIRVWK